jgi:hypothetical protein
MPTLPLSQIFGETNGDAVGGDIAPVPSAPFRAPGQPGHRPRARPPVTLIEGVPTYTYPNGAIPGPRPPKSWSALFEHGEERVGSGWRESALSLFFSQLPLPNAARTQGSRVPALANLCLRLLLRCCSSAEELEGYAPFISPHLRRELLRWCAVNRPLSDAELNALCADEGHVDGELVVVGPEVSLPLRLTKRLRRKQPMGPSILTEDEEEWAAEAAEENVASLDVEGDWDQSSLDIPPPLTSLVLLKTSLPTSSAFPPSLSYILAPTITHLALLALPRPIHVHRLPEMCPLIEVLDLSYNSWLGEPSGEWTLERVEWKRWHALKVLGLKECGVVSTKLSKVNEGRWIDVEIVGVETG